MLYEELNQPCVPAATNVGLFWPRRKLAVYPGSITLSFLPAIPPGLSGPEFKTRLSTALETETDKLIREALARPDAPPVSEDVLRRYGSDRIHREHKKNNS